MSCLKKTIRCWSLKRLHPKLSPKSASLSVFQAQHTACDYVHGANNILEPVNARRSIFSGTEHGPQYVSNHGTLGKGIRNYARMLSMEPRSNGAECWSCGRSKLGKGFVICPSCNAIQAPDPEITYFEIFDQEPRFDLDLKDLETKYKSLMKKLHPDLTHGKSVEEKKNYARWSAHVTAAYTELLRPVSRATYLLKLRAIHVEEEGTVSDPELIMEVMEIKETLQGKPERAVLEQLNKQASARMDEWSHAFKNALKEGNNTAAISSLQRMSYFGRVCDDIHRELL